MLRHNLLLIYRNFKRYKSTFIINLIGLSTSLVCALLIYLWDNDELSMDKFHEKDSRFYQVMKNLEDVQGIRTGEHAPGLLGRALVEEMPEVERAVSVFPPPIHTLTGVVSLGNNHLKARSQFADKDFSNVFSYPLLWGDKERALSEPSSVVISEALAIKLFQTSDNPVGKTVAWKGEDMKDIFIFPVFLKPFHSMLRSNLTSYLITICYWKISRVFAMGKQWLKHVYHFRRRHGCFGI